MKLTSITSHGAPHKIWLHHSRLSFLHAHYITHVIDVCFEVSSNSSWCCNCLNHSLRFIIHEELSTRKLDALHIGDPILTPAIWYRPITAICYCMSNVDTTCSSQILGRSANCPPHHTSAYMCLSVFMAMQGCTSLFSGYYIHKWASGLRNSLHNITYHCSASIKQPIITHGIFHNDFLIDSYLSRVLTWELYSVQDVEPLINPYREVSVLYQQFSAIISWPAMSWSKAFYWDLL